MEGQPLIRGVQDEVHRAPDRDGEEHHDEEEPEAGSGRVVHFPIVLAVLLPLFSLGALIAIRRGAMRGRFGPFPCSWRGPWQGAPGSRSRPARPKRTASKPWLPMR
jgi:hypothetical protein